MGDSDLHDAVALVLEKVNHRLGEPPILREAIDEVYLIVADHMDDDANAADMHMEALRELEDADAARR